MQPAQAPEVLNGLRHPEGLINCEKHPSFALGLLLFRLCAGHEALENYPLGWQVSATGVGGDRIKAGEGVYMPRQKGAFHTLF